MDRIFLLFMVFLNAKVENQTPTNYHYQLVPFHNTQNFRHCTDFRSPASSQCGDNVFLGAIPRFSTMEENFFSQPGTTPLSRGSLSDKILIQKTMATYFTTTHRSWKKKAVQKKCFCKQKKELRDPNVGFGPVYLETCFFQENRSVAQTASRTKQQKIDIENSPVKGRTV